MVSLATGLVWRAKQLWPKHLDSHLEIVNQCVECDLVSVAPRNMGVDETNKDGAQDLYKILSKISDVAA